MLNSIYPHLPIALQNLACCCHGLRQHRLRYGGEFHKLLDWLEESQWWPADRIRAYQEERLVWMVGHVYETVPFYRDRLREHGISPADIRGLDDLPKLPLLTKEDVRCHADSLVSSTVRAGSLEHCHTSGTSGKSLDFLMERRAFQFRWAVWWRHRMRFGVPFDSPYATFTGLTAVPLQQDRPPYWRVNLPMKQTVFTMHHVTPDKVQALVERLNRGGFVYYSGYPSILYQLALMIADAGLKIVQPPKIIFTGAENLYDEQRRVISEVFCCPVTDEYGFSEGCGNASRCPEDRFHEDFEYGILERVDPEPNPDGTVRGRIVATGFASVAMPFVRYCVGDIGVWDTKPCGCGRHSRTLVRIEGRLEDFVATPEGRKILRFDYVFKDSRNIREAQIVQNELGRITVRVVRREAYSTRDEDLIRREIRDKVSAGLSVDFAYPDEIERESNGKFKAVTSNLAGGRH